MRKSKVAFVFDKPDSCDECPLVIGCKYKSYHKCRLHYVEHIALSSIIDPFSGGKGMMQHLEREMFLRLGVALSNCIKPYERKIPIPATKDIFNNSISDLYNTEMTIDHIFIKGCISDDVKQ
jgi:hypothetical protein